MLSRRSWMNQPHWNFCFKIFFHSHYQKYFAKVAVYPDMVAWLEGVIDEDYVDIWGYKRMACTFTDLKAWLANGGPIEPEESDGYEKIAKNMKRGKEKTKWWIRWRERRRRRAKKGSIRRRVLAKRPSKY